LETLKTVLKELLELNTKLLKEQQENIDLQNNLEGERDNRQKGVHLAVYGVGGS
jgi:hypothetical protein